MLKASLGTNSSMFANCSVFCDVWHVQSSVLGQNVMFGSVRSSVLLLCDHTSLGTNSSIFANCSLFCDARHVRGSVLGQNVMFGSVRSSVQLLCDKTSLGTYSLMFTNCLVFCDVRHVRSLILGQNVMFRKFDVQSVRSSVRLLCDQTSLGTYSLMFANCSVFCDVRHVRSSILGQNVMFRKFDVQTFNVWSVWSSVICCSFQD